MQTALRRYRNTAFVLALAPAFALAPSPASATPLDHDPAVSASQAARANPATEKARELEAAARALEGDHAQLGRAAELLRAAAELREDGDPKKLENLTRAASFNHYAGRDRRAYRDLVEAAEVAARQGRVAEAASVRLDAAWMARNLGQSERVIEHVEAARLLAGSPLLDGQTRADLLTRIGVLS